MIFLTLAIDFSSTSKAAQSVFQDHIGSNRQVNPSKTSCRLPFSLKKGSTAFEVSLQSIDYLLPVRAHC